MTNPETQGQPSAPENPTPPVAPPVEDVKVHPAYDKLLAEIPEAWHSKVTPYLQEQDRYFQQQIEKFTPFKDYIEQGVSTDLITGGLNLARAVEANPLEVFNSLKEYLVENGMIEKEAEKQAAQAVSNIEDGEEPTELERKIAELEAFKEEQLSRSQEAELEKATQFALQELDRDMSALKSQYVLTEAHEQAIYNLMNASLNAGQEITVAQAAQQLQQMIGAFPGVNGSTQAPTVIGGSGGAGVPAPDLSVPKDDKGKREMLAKMFQDYNSNR